jgi:hypothetical protein
MAGANSNISLVGLDFNAIKNNLKTYLQSQDTFKDYNFDGSSLSVILDILAYNTQYNAFYLNMVANEMFLDTALQRSSVVSHAKLLNYTPKSTVSPTAYINIVCSNVTDPSVTLPAYSNFLSESIDGTNYNFVNTETITINTANNSVTFEDVLIKQGIAVNYRFTVDSTTNSTYTFELPDSTIDTSTLRITIQKSSSNSYIDIYDLAQDYIAVNGESKVYFLQEALNGNYEIYFGDDIIGKKLEDGNIVIADYITSEGVASSGANNFVLIDNVNGFERNLIYGKIAASQGQDKESIDSIKFTAPKSYVAQRRAVTKEDYIYLLQQNSIGLSFDAVNVWGGEENNPPVYGQVYVAIKPTGDYVLTESQKQKIINNILMPVSVMTVTPKLVDIDYVYLVLEAKVLYDPKKTNLTVGQIAETVKQGTIDYCNNTLNTFNSTFVVGELINYVQKLNQSIIAVDYDVFLQKRLIPELNKVQDYTVNFGGSVERAAISSESIKFTPSFAQYDDRGNYYPEVYIEESPDLTTNVDSINIINGGNNYTNPTIAILGDGTGATATATVKNGTITEIVITSGGYGYTQAIAQITDSTGYGAVLSVVLLGNYGDLRSFYFVNGVKNILQGATHTSRVGYVKYDDGTLTLSNFNANAINSTDGIMKITGYAESRIINSGMDRIITLDVNDPEAISVTVTTK